jgi:hypothetical protein
MSKDFFISYTAADRTWAEWVAWELEEAGYTTVLQAWDFLPGSHFVLKMQEATAEAQCTIAILSPAYFDSPFAKAEWEAAFSQDPTGDKRTLLPVRVKKCNLVGMSRSIVCLDLIGLNEAEAREALLFQADLKKRQYERAKPPTRPNFPGAARLPFPGSQPRQGSSRRSSNVPSGPQTQRSSIAKLKGFESVLLCPFGPHGTQSTAKSSSMSIDTVYNQWIRESRTSDPLILILDFAADIPQMMLAISHSLPDAQWIRGDFLMNLGEVGSDQRIDSIIDSISQPTIFFIDFSTVRPTKIFSLLDARGTSALAFNRTLSAFCELASSHGHRMIIGLPHFMLYLFNIEEIKSHKPYVFKSADLFSDGYNERLQYCQELLGKDRPLNAEFHSLVRVNSIALPRAIATFLSALPEGVSLNIHPDNPSGIRTLIELAQKLTEEGFYEVAYRLEVYCRTLRQQQGLISLDADVHLTSPSQIEEEAIVGCIKGLEKLPAVVLNCGILTGEPGAGKTTGLLQMEHFWALPQLSVDRAKHPCWVPILTSLDPSTDISLDRQIQAHMKKHSFVEIGHGERYQLACHGLLTTMLAGGDSMAYLPPYGGVDAALGFSAPRTTRRGRPAS